MPSWRLEQLLLGMWLLIPLSGAILPDSSNGDLTSSAETFFSRLVGGHGMSPKSEPVQSYFALRILKSFAITYKGGTLSEVRYARPGLGSLFPGEGLALLVNLHSVAFDADLRRVAHGPIG